jgi:hypothetical protein
MATSRAHFSADPAGTHGLLALNLKRNVVGKLPGRFLESLVEGGHGSEEILQGRASEANSVWWSEDCSWRVKMSQNRTFHLLRKAVFGSERIRELN